MTSKTSAITATLTLLVVAIALFFPALIGGKMIAPLDITTTLLPPWNENAQGAKPHNHNPSDAVTQYIPYRLFAEKSFKEDGYIGWNPYEMGGYNLAGNTMALPGTWTMQLHRFLSFKDAWNLGIIAEFIIAGFGMLVFLRSRELPWLPCLIGATAFMFNAQFIIWIYHRWALGSFCWMPWVCWAFGTGFQVGPLNSRIFLLPAFLGLAFLGGSLQHAAFIVLTCGCLAAGSFNFRRPLHNLPSVAGWSAVMMLGLGMAVFTLVPQISAYLSNVAIGHVRGEIGYKNGLSQILFHILLIPARMWPWLAGDPQTIDGWRLLKSGFMDLNYLGTIPMLLGFAGLFIKEVPKTAKWLILTGLLIPLTPLVGPLYHRVELLFILGASWMAAEVLAQIPRLTLPAHWQRWLMGAVAALGAVLLIGACLPQNIRGKIETQVVSQAVAKSEDSQFGADKKWIRSRALEWTSRFSLLHPRTAWVYGLLVLGSSGLVLTTRRANNLEQAPETYEWIPRLGSHAAKRPVRATNQTVGFLMILGATTLELATLFQSWTTFSNPADLHPPNPLIETVRTLASNQRVLQSAPDADFAGMFATPNLLAAQFIPSIDAYESIQYPSLLTATEGSEESLRLTLAGVGLAIQPLNQPQPGTESWPVIGQLSGYTIHRNPAPLASVIAGSGRVPFSLAEIENSLTRSTPIQPLINTPNRLAFHQPAGMNWIRIGQNWHKGWKWRTSGGDWKPFRYGSDAACWIESLPQNQHKIEVQFFPRPQWQAMVSWGAILILGLAFTVDTLILRIEKRKAIERIPQES